MSEPIIFMDTEVFTNYFLVKFMSEHEGFYLSYDCGVGCRFQSPYQLKPLIEPLFRNHTVVTFNGIHFDIPILAVAMKSGSTLESVKRACDLIINHKLKPWDIEREFNVRVPKGIDHIDLIDVAPLVGSLKVYGGRLHTRIIRDLPYPPDKILTEEEARIVSEYCGNDLVITQELYNYLKPQITLRETMGKEYGVDLRSKSDAQIGEKVFAVEVEKLSGERPRRGGSSSESFGYIAPPWISFSTPELKRLLLDIQLCSFAVVGGKLKLKEAPKGSSALSGSGVKIGNGSYVMGVGGLHSTEKNVSRYSDDDFGYVDRDVVSYYPELMLKCNVSPSSLTPHFRPIYKGFVGRRKVAKRNMDKVPMSTLKIVLNAAYGKLNSEWSIFFSPEGMIRVTLTGQLLILMLIETLEINGIEVVNANTDGVVIKYPRGLKKLVDYLIFEWENATGFNTEETEYKSLHSRDVNNYVAVKRNGDVKLKGAYGETGLSKNPTNFIVVADVISHLTKGTPVGKVIVESKDIRGFLTLRKVTGGANDQGGNYLGKVVRWYRSTRINGPIRYVTNGNAVAGSDRGKECMTLPDSFPVDVDKDWYVAEAYDMLGELGVSL